MRFSFLLVFLFSSLYSAFFFFVALQLKGNFFFHFKEEEEEVDVVVVVIPLYLLCQWINIKRRKNKWSVLDSDLFPPVIADCLTVLCSCLVWRCFTWKHERKKKRKKCWIQSCSCFCYCRCSSWQKQQQQQLSFLCPFVPLFGAPQRTIIRNVECNVNNRQ